MAATIDITELLPPSSVDQGRDAYGGRRPPALVTYTLALSNTGVVTAYDVHRRDALPHVDGRPPADARTPLGLHRAAAG